MWGPGRRWVISAHGGSPRPRRATEKPLRAPARHPHGGFFQLLFEVPVAVQQASIDQLGNGYTLVMSAAFNVGPF